MLQQQQIDQARGVSVATLASQHTKLAGRARPKGSCPFCSGNDFNIDVTNNRWHCNGCTPRGDDSIGFICKVDGIDFRQAVTRLAEGLTDGDRLFFRHKAIPSASLPSDIRQHIAMNHQRLMHGPDGQTGRDYLMSRGLFPQMLEPFKLGYYPAVNAITLPWYDMGGNVVAVRYRFIDSTEHRYRAQQGSTMTGYLFGTQATRNRSNLVIVEGEVNALTLYQIALDFDVLSIGGESQMIPIWVTEQYDRILVWCDKESRALEKAKGVGAYRAYWSDEDANELCKFWPNAHFEELPYHPAHIITRPVGVVA